MRGSKEPEYVEIACVVKQSTDRAHLIYDGVFTVWIPLSQIQATTKDRHGAVSSITIPEWLAEAKGLL